MEDEEWEDGEGGMNERIKRRRCGELELHTLRIERLEVGREKKHHLYIISIRTLPMVSFLVIHAHCSNNKLSSFLES